MKHCNTQQSSDRGSVFQYQMRTHLYIILFLLTVATSTSCKNTNEKETEAETETVQQYTFDQQVFCLNMLSNISAHYNKHDSIADSTENAIINVFASDEIQTLIGEWKCVWGPKVFVADSVSKIATNTMFIAQKLNTDTFVVAIAGTDPHSFTDWLFEDFNMITTCPWDIRDKAKGKITAATCTGLTTLKGMSILGGETVKSFIEKVARDSGKVNVWVTGHSLGGALAPVYALHLNNSIQSATVNINCLAVAGATPGDSIFAAYYNSVLGPNTRRVWNTRDLVPHGYEVDMLEEVPQLYGDSTDKFPSWSQPTLNRVINICADKNYTQLQPSITNSFTSAIYEKDSLKGFSDSLIHSFYGQAVFQHIPAYGVYFNTFDFQKEVQNTLKLDAPFFTEGAYLRAVYDEQ